MVMTLAVVCAMDYPDSGVIFFDSEHNFSPKRLLQVAIARISCTHRDQKADINELAAALIKRIRIVKIKSMTEYVSKLYRFKEIEVAMHLLHIKLLITDCVTALFTKVDGLTYAQRQHQMLRMARDLKLFADTYQAFVVVTNRVTTVEGVDYTNPQLGEEWAHCATTRIVMEQHSHYKSMTIVKSSVAGYVVQPFTIKEGGVQAIGEDNLRRENFDEFAIHDDLLSNFAMTALPANNPACTLLLTQLSNLEESESTQFISPDIDVEHESKSNSLVQEMDSSSVDIVSDTNSETGDDSLYWDEVKEE
ncbi:hypothetical protein CCR75_008143 [Bremia lactucae]|uniref:Rad51-like C-terminal domain-containing protein n=1 Tax=Bremia lactucae TaxID=4779 RepID=A0A976IK62_BRELC|nr:hypothetical protein CCR75_008143 [Bremia lactucae]